MLTMIVLGLYFSQLLQFMWQGRIIHIHVNLHIITQFSLDDAPIMYSCVMASNTRWVHGRHTWFEDAHAGMVGHSRNRFDRTSSACSWLIDKQPSLVRSKMGLRLQADESPHSKDPWITSTYPLLPIPANLLSVSRALPHDMSIPVLFGDICLSNNGSHDLHPLSRQLFTTLKGESETVHIR